MQAHSRQFMAINLETLKGTSRTLEVDGAMELEDVMEQGRLCSFVTIPALLVMSKDLYMSRSASVMARLFRP